MDDIQEEDEVSFSASKPKITPPPRPVTPDPVKIQKKKDVNYFKKLDTPPVQEKLSVISEKIEPTLSTRIGLQYVREGQYTPGEPRPKFVFPMTKKQKEFFERNRAYTAKKYFCKYDSVKITKPSYAQKFDKKIEVPSPEASSAKVAPRRVTPTASMLYPYPQTEEELALKKPKSGIFINVTKTKEPDADYDSFDLVYSRTPRPKPKGKASKRKVPKGSMLSDISEEDEVVKKKKRKKRKKSSLKKSESEEEEEELSGGEEAVASEDYLTKQFRRKVSQLSEGTSYQSKDYISTAAESVAEEAPPVNKFIQKFRRDSEIKKYGPKRKKVKRGTLRSHSFTSMYQPILKDFFFGCRQGTMHQGDNSFAEEIRDLQGICMPIAAFCFSITKHPNKWTTENVDQVLEYGNNLYISSLQIIHRHNLKKELKPDELQKYCTVGNKKIRFVVEDPEVVGSVRSEEKTVYNITKGLNIFFEKNNAGILKTQEYNIGIWKDKYFYMFDARPRTKDLYCSPDGTAIMANFYDIPSLVTVFLQHTNFGNWPFVIYPMKAFKILNKDDPEIDSQEALNAIHHFSVLSERKAVLRGTFDLGDKCFAFSRGKQSLPMAVVALVYSRITPPSAWQKSTIDKIMLLGNQLYNECTKCINDEIRVENLPALFTIGPYIVEIYIYANIIADLLYKLCCCQLNHAIDDFFTKGTNAIMQIGKDKHISIWKQRNMYYYFDPYSRNTEGFQCRDGRACVSMHSDLESLVNTIAVNFDQDENVFYIHALKVCKIHRDPAQSLRFPRHIPLENFPVEYFEKYKMKKSKKSATTQPVSVDYTALAMIKLLAGEEMTGSINEVGSAIESLNMEHCLTMMTKRPSISILEQHKKITEIVADLDSPSLTDTQVRPVIAAELRAAPNEIEFLDLDSFALTMEEIEIGEVAPEGEDYGLRFRKMIGGEEGEEYLMEEAEFYGNGEDDDWFYTLTKFAQIGRDSLEPTKVSEQINTDITFFPIKKEILYPTYLRDKQRMKYRLQRYKVTEDDWDLYLPPEPTVTQSQELQKETNFILLPDDTEIIYGTKNIAEYGKDIEFIAPFVCIMAGVISRKYSILSWSTEIVDYILMCGNELYAASKFRYDQVSKLEIPRVTIGNMNYAVLVEYVFDTYTRQNILELAIEKILFVRSDVGIFVTPLYACALFHKNYLYYLFDCFGNNEVGLSEGPKNTGTACFARFKDIHSLATRIMYNKKKREQYEKVIYSKFVLSTVKVKEVPVKDDKRRKKREKTKTPYSEEGEEQGDKEIEEVQEEEKEEEEEDEGQQDEIVEKQEPKLIVGYQPKNKKFLIEGSKGLPNRGEVTSEIKADHFICLVAGLMLISCPIKLWDNKRVDRVVDNGNRIFKHAGDKDFSERRIIKNILIDKHFFDIIVKRIKIENWRDRTTVFKGIDTLLARKLSYFLVQFPNACYLIHKSLDDILHLFDPYSVANSGHAGWMKIKNVKMLRSNLKKIIRKDNESFQFFNFEVTSIQKAPKEILMNYKLMEYELERDKEKERFGKTFYEDVAWLKHDPIPWTRQVNYAANGKKRGAIDNMWNNWDIEYAKDLYSLMGNIHQISSKFSDKTRGNQTLANLVVSIGMMEIYDLAEWNSAVVDSILVNGDNYFTECIKDINDEDYELSMDDLLPECSIFPFSFNVTFTPVVEGTMFLVRNTQFNLYKALRYFFYKVIRRCGIICSDRSGNKRQVAFGKLHESEYFMFDCELVGGMMFLEGCGVAYILRTTTLNRLLHVLTLTLRGGDFYIYEVEVTDIKPIN